MASSFLPPLAPTTTTATPEPKKPAAPTRDGGTAAPPVAPPLQGMRRGALSLFKALGSSEHEKRDHPFIPEVVTTEKLLQKHWTAVQRLRVTDTELEAVVNDDASFYKIQQALRDRCAQTDAVAEQIAPTLLRDCLEAARRAAMARAELEEQEERLRREEQRRLEIARELAEARIKARQALMREVDPSGGADDDGDRDYHPDALASPSGKPGATTANNSTSASESPTSVMNTLSLSEEQLLVAFKPGLEEDMSSEDGDIQEIDREEE